MSGQMRKTTYFIIFICMMFCTGVMAEGESWICPNCNQERTTNFCPDDGTKRPDSEEWTCSACGAVNTSKFCSSCGAEKPISVADGYVENKEIVFEIGSRNCSGKYTGNVINGKPSGEGKFVGEDESGNLMYEGTWDSGKPSGKGYMNAKGFDLDVFGNVEDTGNSYEYSGETQDGIPSGYGQVKGVYEGVPFEFTGEFTVEGINGYGEAIYKSDPVWHMKGNYTNNEFTPTFAQLVDTYISITSGYFLSDEQLSFIEDNEDLFCSRPNSIPKAKLASSFDSAKFMKTQKAEKKLVKVGGTVGQVRSYDLYGITCEEIIFVGNKGTIYYGYLYGDTDLVAETKTTLYLYPVSYFTYQTIENVYKKAVLCVYVKTK